MASNVNPGDPRVKRTRKLLQHAFMELLEKKNFEAITIQDITEHAGMNRATFYSHFQDKYELLDLTLGTMFTGILSKWIPSGAEMKGEALMRSLMLAVCQWQTEVGQGINRRLPFSSSIEQNSRKQLYEIIFSCLKQAEPICSQESRPLEVISTILSHSIYGVVLQWSHTPKSETAEELVECALPLIMPVLGAIGLAD